MLSNEEKIVINLANAYSDPSEFINHMEKSANEIEKASFFTYIDVIY